MARKVTPNSWAETTAYIAEGTDVDAEAVSFGGGQHVKIVDHPVQAGMRIRVSKGRERFYSAVEARQLAEGGLAARSEVASAPTKDSWFRRYMAFSLVTWGGVVFAFAMSGSGSVGQALLIVLMTPVVMVVWPPILRRFRNELSVKRWRDQHIRLTVAAERARDRSQRAAMRGGQVSHRDGRRRRRWPWAQTCRHLCASPGGEEPWAQGNSRRFALLACALSALLFSLLGVSPSRALGQGASSPNAGRDQLHCPRGQEVAVQGGPDGCTHGRDPAPHAIDVRKRRSIPELAAGDGSAGAPAGAAAAQVPCVGDGTSGQRVEAIYAYPADKPDRYAEVAPLIEGWAAEVSQTFDDSAAETGGSRRVGFLTSGCQLVVRKERLSTAGDDTFGATVNELTAHGYNRADRDYMVWMDSNVLCGVGFVSARFARADNGCWGYAEAHELGHNFGAVSLSAPNTSGGWHCVDEYDRMCYSDDPNHPAMRLVCPDSHERLFDCGHQDYFSTAPPAGSFLQRNPGANIADSPFLVAEDGQRPVFLPDAPAGYRGPRYTLTLDNSDDAITAYAVGPGGERTRVFGVGYLSERRADITGALLAAAGGSGTARVQIIATNKGGGRTLGIKLERSDGATLISEHQGTAGSQSSDLPESTPDPATGWTTFYDRTVELDLREPPPGPSPQPGPAGPGSGGDDSSFGDESWFGDGSGDSAGSTPDRRCRDATRSLSRYQRRAAQTRRRVHAERRGLMRRRHALEARGWPRPAARSYRQARRRYARRVGALKRLDRRVRTLRTQRRRACP